VDAGSHAYVVGSTLSGDFPTVSPIQSAAPGNWDAFVTKLDAGGASLAFSTYFGGSDYDAGAGIAVDTSSEPNIYLTGATASPDILTTPGALRPAFGGTVDAFAARISQLGRPTSKDQCKNDGWRNFPQFKNQGDCVSYVASGGKH
jgi:hypothetical protein